MDADNDGLGDANNFIFECYQPAGYVSNNNDTDDSGIVPCSLINDEANIQCIENN